LYCIQPLYPSTIRTPSLSIILYQVYSSCTERTYYFILYTKFQNYISNTFRHLLSTFLLHLPNQIYLLLSLSIIIIVLREHITLPSSLELIELSSFSDTFSQPSFSTYQIKFIYYSYCIERTYSLTLIIGTNRTIFLFRHLLSIFLFNIQIKFIYYYYYIERTYYLTLIIGTNITMFLFRHLLSTFLLHLTNQIYLLLSLSIIIIVLREHIPLPSSLELIELYSFSDTFSQPSFSTYQIKFIYYSLSLFLLY